MFDGDGLLPVLSHRYVGGWSFIVLVALISYNHFTTYPSSAWALEPPEKHIYLDPKASKIAQPKTFLLQLPNREWESFWMPREGFRQRQRGGKEKIKWREEAWQICGCDSSETQASSAQSKPGQHSQPQLLSQRASSLQLTLDLFPAPRLSLFPQQNGH